MFKKKCTKLVAAMGMTLSAGVAQAAIQDVVVNGDFETGDLTGWQTFTNGGSITVGTPNSTLGPAGSNSARLYSDAGGQFPLLKIERLAAGLLTDGASVTVEFDWYNPIQTVDINAGPLVGNNVVVVQLLTERTGDNGASAEDLIAPPTFLTGGDLWNHASFTTTLGPDAGGGVSLFFQTNTGANTFAAMDFYVDNVSITTDVSAVPVPAAAWLFGSGLLGLVGVARRKKALAA